MGFKKLKNKDEKKLTKKDSRVLESELEISMDIGMLLQFYVLNEEGYLKEAYSPTFNDGSHLHLSSYLFTIPAPQVNGSTYQFGKDVLELLKEKRIYSNPKQPFKIGFGGILKKTKRTEDADYKPPRKLLKIGEKQQKPAMESDFEDDTDFCTKNRRKRRFSK